MLLTQLHQNILEHYQMHHGKSKEISIIPSSNDSKYICRFELEANLFAYCTIGMSDKLQFRPNNQKDLSELRTELFMYSSTVDSQFINLLSILMDYPFVHDTFFAWGHTILGTAPVINDSQMTDILLLPPLNELKSFYSFHLNKKTHIDILWVMPIYRSETIFLRTQSWRNLLTLMINAEIDSSDLSRPSVV